MIDTVKRMISSQMTADVAAVEAARRRIREATTAVDLYEAIKAFVASEIRLNDGKRQLEVVADYARINGLEHGV